MNAIVFVAMTFAATQVAPTPKVLESPTTDNVHAMAGKWRPVESCHHLLDADLVSSRTVGFEISIDKQLGDSHRKSSGSGTYYDNYADFLKRNGHKPVASGYIKFDYDLDSEHIITRKDGSLYLWYGIVSVGNPRIFLGRGPDKHSVETLVMEWDSWCGGSPVDLKRDFATVIYERVDRNATQSLRIKKPAQQCRAHETVIRPVAQRMSTARSR